MFTVTWTGDSLSAFTAAVSGGQAAPTVANKAVKEAATKTTVTPATEIAKTESTDTGKDAVTLEQLQVLVGKKAEKNRQGVKDLLADCHVAKLSELKAHQYGYFMEKLESL